MALATTCPQCKTSFKVIPDQLKLRRGLVRCGVCQHVFSGIDYLRYVDDSSKTKGAAAQPTGTRPRPGPGGSANRPAGVGPGTRLPPQPVASSGVAPASPQTIISSEDELKTAFFLSDSTFGPYSQTRPQDVAPPRSIVSGEVADRPVEDRPGDFTREFFQEGTGRPPAAEAGPRTNVERDALTGQPLRVAGPGRAHRSGQTGPSPGPSPGSASAAGRGEAATPRSTGARDGQRETARVAGAREPAREPAREAAPADGAETDQPIDDAKARRARHRRSLPVDSDDDDPDVAAANALARQAREAHRHGASRRTPSRDSVLRPSDDGRYPEAGIDTFAQLFADPRRRAAVIGLLLLALLQLTLLFRGEIASRLPALRPVVGVVAGIFGMSVDTVRSLPSLSIESFELQTTGRPDQIALNAVLRNRDGHPVRWPAMELTLTDPSSAIVVRKVILPADYLNRSASRDGLGGRSEWPIRLNLDTGGLQLAGYSVALFYP